MPNIHAEPNLVLRYKGVAIHNSYDDFDENEALEYHYVVTGNCPLCEGSDSEIDIRDVVCELEEKYGVTADENDPVYTFVKAIDCGLITGDDGGALKDDVSLYLSFLGDVGVHVPQSFEGEVASKIRDAMEREDREYWTGDDIERSAAALLQKALEGRYAREGQPE